MARRASHSLTDGELRLMRVLWAAGESSVIGIQSALGEPLQESTIRTLLGILSRKGYVARRKDGRAYLYRALVQQDSTRSSAIRQMVRRFFGRPSVLLLELLNSADLDEDELKRIKAAIRAREQRR